MKVIWEEGDIRAGMLVYREAQVEPANYSYLRSVTHQVGFMGGKSVSEPRWTMASILSDGLVTGPYTEKELIEYLNQDYVPIPYGIFMKLTDSNRHRHEN